MDERTLKTLTILTDKNIQNELSLLLYFDNLLTNGYRYLELNYEELAKEFNVSEKTIRRRISKLQKLNYIEIFSNKTTKRIIAIKEVL